MKHDSAANERAFIGSLLNDPTQYWGMRNFIRPEMVEDEHHRTIFNAVAYLVEAGRIVTAPALSAILPEEYDDGKPYVALWMALQASGAEAGSALDYAEALRERYTRKRIRALGEKALKLEGDLTKTADDILAEVEAMMMAAVQDHESEKLVWLSDAAADALAKTAENFRVKDELQIGLRTGIKQLDDLLGPIMGGDMVTLAAMSGHGKTTLAMQILCNAAKGPDARPTMLISQEMQATQIARRMLASWTQVPVRKQRGGDIEMFEYDALKRGAAKANEVRVLVADNGRQTTTRICRQIRSAHRQFNISAAAIDHIQLCKTSNPKFTKIDVIERAAMEFKELAKELDIPIFALAQLTRSSQSDAKSWRFTDQALYGGDAIKQASDIMLGVTLPRKWLRQREPDQDDQRAHDAWVGNMERWDGFAEIGTLKMRDDDDGEWFKLPFDGKTYTFGTRT